MTPNPETPKGTNLSSEEVDDLREFVAQVGAMEASRFFVRLLQNDTISCRMGGDLPGVEFVNFDEEECRAFLLSCRLLIQNNDRISIQKVWALFKGKIADHDWFVKINPPRWMLNDYLDRDALAAAPDGSSVTNRLVLETFLWGYYAHHNRTHRARLDEWKADDRQFPALKLAFLMDLQMLIKSARAMAAAVTQWLEIHASLPDNDT